MATWSLRQVALHLAAVLANGTSRRLLRQACSDDLLELCSQCVTRGVVNADLFSDLRAQLGILLVAASIMKVGNAQKRRLRQSPGFYPSALYQETLLLLGRGHSDRPAEALIWLDLCAQHPQLMQQLQRSVASAQPSCSPDGWPTPQTAMQLWDLWNQLLCPRWCNESIPQLRPICTRRLIAQAEADLEVRFRRPLTDSDRRLLRKLRRATDGHNADTRLLGAVGGADRISDVLRLCRDGGAESIVQLYLAYMDRVLAIVLPQLTEPQGLARFHELILRDIAVPLNCLNGWTWLVSPNDPEDSLCKWPILGSAARVRLMRQRALCWRQAPELYIDTALLDIVRNVPKGFFR